MASSEPPAGEVDLTNCDKEPIHIPAAIQPHGFLLALSEPDLEILQASENVPAMAGVKLDDLLGATLDRIVGGVQGVALRSWLEREQLERPAVFQSVVRCGDSPKPFMVLAHRRQDVLIVELERWQEPEDPTSLRESLVLETVLEHLQEVRGTQSLCRLAAREVRRISGFDTVMVYRFDDQWNGRVVEEDRADHMPSYQGLHFPASDIPQQARDLYVLNRIRLIPDAQYEPALLAPALNPLTGRPLDLSFSLLRSVSPIHIEYLRNMGVRASMSISIVRDGKLWAMIACHHATPRYLSYPRRNACALIGRMLSLLLTTQQATEEQTNWAHVRELQSKLLEAMLRSDDFVGGLVAESSVLLDLVGARGAAVYREGECVAFGNAPTGDFIRQLALWLDQRLEDNHFSTHHLANEYPPAEAHPDTAGGLLAISLSNLNSYYVLWFRPEIACTVYWAGDPGKAVTRTNHGEIHLHPRQSFAAWKEIQRGRSAPWTATDLEAAQTLRRTIIDAVFVKTERLARLHSSLRKAHEALERSNRELRDFTYVVSHDLKSPLVTIKGFLGMLRQDLQRGDLTRLGSDIDRIAKAADRMRVLLDDLLELSRVGRIVGAPVKVKLGDLAKEAVEALTGAIEEKGVRVIIAPDLPTVWVDRTRTVQLLQNLIENATRFIGDQPAPRVEIGARREPNATVCYVRDNGIGVDPAFHTKIFELFTRLEPEGEGSGIGLALAKRIVEFHQGLIWVESEGKNKGATFCFTLPESNHSAEESLGANA